MGGLPNKATGFFRVCEQVSEPWAGPNNCKYAT